MLRVIFFFAVIKQNYTAAITFYYLLLSGAFTSNFLAEWIAIKRPNSSHVIQFH
jgi:hypothetical protein